MNAETGRREELEARLRKLLGGLDASAGFEERVMRRVATIGDAPRADLRAQFERRRALARRRLRREAWMNAATIFGLGACAGALLWRYAPEVERLATGVGLPVDTNLLVGSTLAAFGALVWILVRRMQGAGG